MIFVRGAATLAGCVWGLVWYNWLRMALQQEIAIFILLWGLVEIVFHVIQFQRYQASNYLSSSTPRIPHLNETLLRFLELSNFMKIEPFFSNWFYGAPFNQVKRGNIEEFISYDEKVWTRNAVQMIESTWGVKFQKGYTKDLKFMEHIHEPLKVIHKPLVIYIIMEVIGMISCVVLWTWGFRFERINGMLVMHRQLSSAKKLRPFQTLLLQWRKIVKEITSVFYKMYTIEYQLLVQYHNNYLTFKLDIFENIFKPTKIQQKFDKFELGNNSIIQLCSKTENKSENQNLKNNYMKFDRDLNEKDHNNSNNININRNNNINYKTPILFLHGIGVGSLPYLKFVYNIMRKFPDQPLLLFEMRHISMRWTPCAKSVNDVAANVEMFFSNYGIQKAHVMGHSYGTLVTSVLVNQYKHLVESICLIDPVCLMMCEPTLVRSYVYNGFGPRVSLLDYVRYIFARDLTIAESICRKAQWSSLMLWPADFPEKTVLFIGGQDDLLPINLILKQLIYNKSKAQLVFNEKLSHGEFMFDDLQMDAILSTYKSTLIDEKNC